MANRYPLKVKQVVIVTPGDAVAGAQVLLRVSKGDGQG